MAKATEGYLFPSCFARKKLSPSKITYEAAARPDLRIGTRQQPCFAFCEQGDVGAFAFVNAPTSPCSPGARQSEERPMCAIFREHYA